MNAIEKVNSVITNKNVQNAFYNLYDRWEDEGRYEDINDYGKTLFGRINKNCPNVGATYVGVTEKPFGIKFVVDDKCFHLYVKIERSYLVLSCKIDK